MQPAPDHPEIFAAIQPVIAEFLPILRSFAIGRYAIAISGSYGKGTHDGRSDVDFRLYADDLSATFAEMGQAIRQPQKAWGRKGIQVDDFWPRKIGEVEAALEKWLNGDSTADNHIWTVWGYHLLPDLYHQQALADPDAIVANWKTRLAVYPPKLKQALLDKHLGVLQYWRHDYHYANKVQRQDVVFLAGLSSKLVHALIQVLFALNETYYVGDGQNLEFVARLPQQPPQAVARLRASLDPANLEDQRKTLCELIDDVEHLAATLGYEHQRWNPLA
ncbi:MAG TPA: nucleotidyltransferase domain-containing protein [Phototrophicaceae bacterium]|nr:nucleotidyltransferase domain-containing protein [Phototrophicaceae bacterium]